MAVIHHREMTVKREKWCNKFLFFCSIFFCFLLYLRSLFLRVNLSFCFHFRNSDPRTWCNISCCILWSCLLSFTELSLQLYRIRSGNEKQYRDFRTLNFLNLRPAQMHQTLHQKSSNSRVWWNVWCIWDEP